MQMVKYICNLITPAILLYFFTFSLTISEHVNYKLKIFVIKLFLFVLEVSSWNKILKLIKTKMTVKLYIK